MRPKRRPLMFQSLRGFEGNCRGLAKKMGHLKRMFQSLRGFEGNCRLLAGVPIAVSCSVSIPERV